MAQNDAWLRQAAADGQGGSRAKTHAITRGGVFGAIFSFAADYSSDLFEAYAYASAAENAPALLAFDVEVGAYQDGATPVTISLQASDQGPLPSDSDLDGLEEIVYKVFHTPSDGTRARIIASTMPVSN